MRPSDYTCDKCGIIYEYWKENDLEGFPEKTKCPECGNDKNTRRLFSGIMTDVGQGLCGNASNGYSKNIAYHGSKFGFYKGSQVK